MVFWSELILLSASLLLVYTYFGYPLLLEILSRWRRPHRVTKGPVALRVSMIIPAYNEAASIAAKLENVLALTFPKDRLEILVVSDASSDGTDQIVERYATRGIRLLRQTMRGGKIAAYRAAVPQVTGDIIVFSDATSLLSRDALDRLLENFADPTVGCVVGQLRYVNPAEAFVGNGENTYWEYETRIRLRESALSSLTSVSGTLYGVRRQFYPLDLRDDLADDLVVPLQVKAAGLRTVLEPFAICTETTTLNVNEEMAKRTRITVQNIRGLMHQRALLNPVRYGLFALFLASHKLLRLAVPLLLFLVLMASVMLTRAYPGFIVSVGLQLAFYSIGFLGYLLGARRLHAVFYFCLSNLAVLVGAIRWIKGVRVVTWETMRRT